ncbi:ATP-binding cassette domain-containing protein [Aeromicrobium chenweiae]|uniref:Daunorubicin/doxorubicin resistance ABC transporter ATP-binding protein DrrA n=1 Tax=Aeromicrobium chenweiae TaxID=2079793 RepID=A0A2S0WPM6_9ACTN|nr:ATP-binding cassette domain-containing protein [Aeromicrobium chenweiae]AWB93299.1 daunorubicin/doxorubicin resistance ABC transporter ATP-binding protein DrrA [Aeromicrobium chenweiae]TGN34291.1 ATP-binding cassette domain-containing protein [Aeromicrobium chenweiae]
MTNAIHAESLTKRYGDTIALDGIDLSVPEGSVLGVLGPNGAGKTTAVRILATLLRPDSGTAIVAGHDVLKDPNAVRRSIGLTGQYASVDEQLTGRENLELFARLLDFTRPDARARARELLEQFGLTEAGDRRIRTYSGGMRRRLDLAASLVGRPAVIFLDEPTTGLDPSKRDDVWNLVRLLAAEGTSVLLTTQYLEEADALADAITVIDRGLVIANGTASELKQIVGGRSLQVRPAEVGDTAQIRTIISRITGRPVDEPARGVLSAPIEAEEDFTSVVVELASRSIPLTEISLSLPSLDEVFFTLTGQGAAPASSTENDKELVR